MVVKFYYLDLNNLIGTRFIAFPNNTTKGGTLWKITNF